MRMKFPANFRNLKLMQKQIRENMSKKLGNIKIIVNNAMFTVVRGN